jgi:hypothetical protein
MKKFTKRLVLSSVISLMAFTGLYFTAQINAGSGERAGGHGTLLVQDENGRTVRRQFSFNARRNNDGTVRGHAVLHNPAFTGTNGQRYQLHVDISCMRVYGNIAVFGGTTRRTNDENLIDAVYFSVQDNGEPGKDNDKISSVFFFDDDPTTTGDPQLCQFTGPNDFPLNTIEAGNIQVSQ